MKTNFFKFIIFIIALGLVGGGVYLWQLKSQPVDQHQHAADVYYCPMHPDYQSDRLGKCPICHMDLVKKENKSFNENMAASSIPSHSVVHLNNQQQKLINVKTVAAKRAPLVKTVTAYGEVKHYVDLYKLQDEYIKAYVDYITTVRNDERYKNRRRNWAPYREIQIKLLEAEHKLLELGLGHNQIEQLQIVNWRNMWEQPEFLFFNKENNFWIQARLFEDDLGYVDVGQDVDIDIPAYKEKLKGIVRSVGGIVDRDSRSVRVIIEPLDYRGELSVNMIANVSMKVELDNKLLVPASAIMHSGERNLVFVEVQDGVYEPREVALEAQNEEFYSITKGLTEEERVVVSGNFLIDSESRLQAALNNFDTAVHAGHGGQ